MTAGNAAPRFVGERIGSHSNTTVVVELAGGDTPVNHNRLGSVHRVCLRAILDVGQGRTLHIDARVLLTYRGKGDGAIGQGDLEALFVVRKEEGRHIGRKEDEGSVGVWAQLPSLRPIGLHFFPKIVCGQ